MTQHDLVELDRDHPGFRDPDYRSRRNTIASIAHEHVIGTPVAMAPYTQDEDRLWQSVQDTLAPLHELHAAAPYLRAKAALALAEDRVPQLRDINQRLASASPFSMVPVAGLISPRVFLSHLAQDKFLSTQYIRHASRPFYTPEPDVIHECVGHAPTFLDPDMIHLNRLFGEALLRSQGEEAETRLIRAYWYTLEFGMVFEDGHPKAIGAGLLSSVDELNRAVSQAPEPFDLSRMSETPFDPSQIQEFYFAARDFDSFVADTADWLARF